MVCFLIADSLTVAEIVGIGLGVFFFFIITSIITCCVCCFIPTCPCYYKRRSYYSVRSVLVEQPQVVTATAIVFAVPSYGKPSTMPPTGYQAKNY